jgi:hypothetical protein
VEVLSNGKGKLAEASEEGQGPSRVVEPMTTIKYLFKNHENNTDSSEVCLQTLFFHSLLPLLQPCANEKQARVCPVGTILLVCVSSSKWWTQVSSAVTIRDEKASHISRTPWNIRAHGWCAKWGFRSLTIEHKTYRKAIYSEMLARSEADVCSCKFVNISRLSKRLMIIHTTKRLRSEGKRTYHCVP